MKRQILLSVALSFLMAGIACADGIIVIPKPPEGIPFMPYNVSECGNEIVAKHIHSYVREIIRFYIRLIDGDFGCQVSFVAVQN